MSNSRTAVAASMVLALAGGLAACDDQPQRSERTMEGRERTVAEGRTPAPPQAVVPDVKPGARSESPPGTAAKVVGTWRLRVKSGADEAQPGITYTFTADSRVTVGPNQTCLYKLENDVLSIDCAGTSAESASGRLEREDKDHLIWRVAGKTVRLDRQAGVKEQ